jgi:surfeit locus 1 family protein
MPRSRLFWLGAFFSRRWWWATLVVLLGMAFLARLGVWQLDRLAQRKARNAQIIRQLELPPILLTEDPLPDDLSSLKYRRASVSGKFDFSNQVALLHQNHLNSPGIHLITPLVIEGSSQAVLVDRGWLPTDQAGSEHWSKFERVGPTTVTGFIQLSQTLPGKAREKAPQVPAKPQSEWYRVDVEAIQAQMPYDLLSVYVLESPSEKGEVRLPYQVEPEFDLSSGSHLSYAIQWFIFALILGVIYVRYVSNKEKEPTPEDQ